jgi:hypothetical protein
MIKKTKGLSHEEIIKGSKRIIREEARLTVYDDGDLKRMNFYNIPESLRKRFFIFSAEISSGFFYQSTFSNNSIVDSRYYSIKCNAFSEYISNINIQTIREKKEFLNFLDEVICYEPPLLRKWEKNADEILEENELTRIAISKICNEYIRNKKIKKILE